MRGKILGMYFLQRGVGGTSELEGRKSVQNQPHIVVRCSIRLKIPFPKTNSFWGPAKFPGLCFGYVSFREGIIEIFCE